MSHIINDCPINKFEGGLAILHTDCFRFCQRVAALMSLHTLKKEKKRKLVHNFFKDLYKSNEHQLSVEISGIIRYHGW